MELTYYPINDFGPLMKGIVIGGLGIFHVLTAHFAIGGGMLMCYFQWLAMTGRSESARVFVSSYFKFLVMISFVAGSVTGVAMWLTSIQISPATIGLMIDTFHWLWAVEWSFFCLEVVAGYMFYRYGPWLSDQSKLWLLGLYTFAAWQSLFWINGILSWQLTPGVWAADPTALWGGFFNPSFWPSLFYRTIACLTVASLIAMFVINCVTELNREQRKELIHHAALLLSPMILMPVLGVWFVLTLPTDAKHWILGGSVAMTLFLNIAVGSSLLIGLYAVYLYWNPNAYVNAGTAALLVALAAGATAGGEFVREGVRKPYTIRDVLYSNAIPKGKVQALRNGRGEDGKLMSDQAYDKLRREKPQEFLKRLGPAHIDPFPLRDYTEYPTEQTRIGAIVFRQQCSICHTVKGVNSLVDLAGTWTTDQKRLNFSKLQHTKPFMPPFAGPPSELEALVQFVEWHVAGKPKTWAGTAGDTVVLGQIQDFLDQATAQPGTQPIRPLTNERASR